MSNRRVDKKSQIPTIRILTTMLAMLFSVSVYAKPEFQEYRDTAENGIIISISNPRYDYEVSYQPYYDKCYIQGDFSVQVEINHPTDVYMHKGYIDAGGIVHYVTLIQFEDHPVNEPFRISTLASFDKAIKFFYKIPEHKEGDIPFYNLDLEFRVYDFISDEDKEKLYGSVDDVQAVDNNAPVVAKRNGKLVIDWNGTESCGSTVSIFNLNGIRQYARSVAESSQETEIPMESIPQGICIVHIQTEKTTYTQKIKL